MIVLAFAFLILNLATAYYLHHNTLQFANTRPHTPGTRNVHLPDVPVWRADFIGRDSPAVRCQSKTSRVAAFRFTSIKSLSS